MLFSVYLFSYLIARYFRLMSTLVIACSLIHCHANTVDNKSGFAKVADITIIDILLRTFLWPILLSVAQSLLLAARR